MISCAYLRRFFMTLSTTLITLIASFLVSVILAPIIIPYLRRMKFGQSIREEGPESHQKKLEHLPWVV